ncbi:MAG: hypothetical protein ACJA0U_000178 [Salibacteraceae bacterium]|jgi:hypothetical protein
MHSGIKTIKNHEKRSVSSTDLIAISTGVKAQDSFYEGIAKVEGTKFQEYIFTSAVPEKEGYYHAENPHRVVTVKTQKTEKGNYCGFIGYEEGGDSRGFMGSDEISYSRLYPSLVAHKYTKVGVCFY